MTDKITVDFNAPSNLENGDDFTKFEVYVTDRFGDPKKVTCLDSDPLTTSCEFEQNYIESEPFKLKLGGVLKAYVIAYNSYGPAPKSGE